MKGMKHIPVSIRPVLVMTVLLLAAARPAAAEAGTGGLCPAQPDMPVVDVTVEEKPLRFGTEADREALTKMSGTFNGPYPGHDKVYDETFVGGVTEGRVELFHDVTFGRATNETTGESCVWIEKVDVRLVLDPVIHIASDLETSDCWYQEIYRHELKHVAVDRRILQKYTGQITDALSMVFTNPDDVVSGVYEAESTPEVRNAMRDMISYPLGVMFDKMMKERQFEQQLVDNPAEYARVAQVCRDEKLPAFSLSDADHAKRRLR